MKESTKEDLANHFGVELYADGVDVMGVATTEVYAGKLLSSVPHPQSADSVCVAGRQNVWNGYVFSRSWVIGSIELNRSAFEPQ